MYMVWCLAYCRIGCIAIEGWILVSCGIESEREVCGDSWYGLVYRYGDKYVVSEGGECRDRVIGGRLSKCGCVGMIL